MYTHTLRHSGTRTRMLLPAPEQCRICLPRIHVFDSSKCLRRYTNTHTHAYTHAGLRTQIVRASVYVHTPEWRNVCMPQIYVFGSRKCKQMHTCAHWHTHTPIHKHAVARDVAVHTHTRTHIHTLVQQNVPCASAQKKFHSWDTTASLKHPSGNTLTRPLMPARTEILPLRKKMFCVQVLDVLHSLHRGQSNPFWKKAHLVLSSQHESESIYTFYSHGGRFVLPVDRTLLIDDHNMKAEATEKGVGGMA